MIILTLESTNIVSSQINHGGIPHKQALMFTTAIFLLIAGFFRFSNFPPCPYYTEDFAVSQPDTFKAKFQIKNSLSELNLKGRVRKLTETEYDGVEVSGKIQRGIVGEKKISFFDTSGYLTNIQYYPQSNTKSLMKTLFIYDNKLGITKECLYVELAGKSVIWRKLITRYDEKSRKIEREQFIHFAKDSLVQESKTIFRYDSNDLKCEGITCTTIKAIQGNTSDTSRDSYIYDRKGNALEKKSIDQMGMATISKFKYNQENNLVEIRNYFPEGKLQLRKTDKAGRNMDQYRPKPNEEVIRFKYLKFDKIGNWLLELKSEYFINTYTLREIDYY